MSRGKEREPRRVGLTSAHTGENDRWYTAPDPLVEKQAALLVVKAGK